MKKIKLFFACLLMAVFSIGQIRAADESVTFSAQSYTNGQAVESYSGDDFTIEFFKGTNNNAPKYYTQGSAIRCYAKNGFIVSSSTKTITEIVLAFGSGDGSNAITTSVEAYSNGTWSNEDGASSVTFTIGGTNGNRRLDGVAVTYKVEQPGGGDNPPAVTVAKPEIGPSAGNFVGQKLITLTCTTEGAAIYYTLNGSAPSAINGIPYTEPFPISETTTVKAIAVKENTESGVASATYTKLALLQSLDEIYTKANEVGNTATTVAIDFGGWIVSAVRNTTTYLTDGSKGLTIYGSNPGFVAGDVLSGNAVVCQVQLYNGSAQLKSLSPNTEGLQVTSDGELDPIVVAEADVADLTGLNTGSLIKIQNSECSSASGKFYIANGTLQLYNGVYDFTVTPGSKYDCTGVFIQFGETKELMPRNANDIVEEQAATLPEVGSLAALKAAEKGTYIATFTDVIVTYVNGNNAFIEDAEAGALIYKSGHGFNAGDKLSGKFQVTTLDFSGKFEITAIAAVENEGTVTSGTEIPFTVMTLEELSGEYENYESRRILVEEVTVTDAIGTGDRNGVIRDLSDIDANLYAGVSGIVAQKDHIINAYGYPTIVKNGNNVTYQFAVWEQAAIEDITPKAPELSFPQASYQATAGGDFEAPELGNPHNLTVTYSITESSAENLAMVDENAGDVLIGDEEGYVVITASFAGNSEYAAGSASYTIYIAAAATPQLQEYPMYFDLSRACYDAASADQVTWNSNVLTMVADKNNASTAPNSYLGEDSNNRSSSRFYKNSTLTLTPKEGVLINRVEFTATSTGYASVLANSTWTNATAEVDGQKVTITPALKGNAFSAAIGGTTGSDKVTVFYSTESDEEKALLAAAIEDHDAIEMTVNGEVTLSTLDISRTPQYARYNFSVAEGSETLIEINDGVLTALAEGTATLNVAFDAMGNYTAAANTITVNIAPAPTKATPNLAWAPEGDQQATLGEAFDAPVVTYAEGFDGTIDYDSSNPAVATINTNGEITLVGAGETTITASSAETTNFSEGLPVSFVLTVSEPAAPVVYYEKVTSNAALLDGSYLIVHESDFGSVALDGSLTTLDKDENTIEVEINSDRIVATEAVEAAKFTIDVTAGTIQSASGYYIGHSGNKNNLSASLDAATYTNSISIDNSGDADIACGDYSIRFNSTRFRYYSSGQEPVQLYKKLGEVVKQNPQLAYTPKNIQLAVNETSSFQEATLNVAPNFDGQALITFSSDNENVAMVDEQTGEVVLMDVSGTATITASFPGNDTYKAGTASYTITVTPVITGIVITGDATNKVYEEGATFNPAGLVVNYVYSDQTQAAVTEEIQWSFEPATLSATDDAVIATATVGNYPSADILIEGLTVTAAPVLSNVVILAKYGSKYYAMSTALNSSGACPAIEVEKSGENIIVTSAEDKAAIQWSMLVDESQSPKKASFQDANDSYLKGVTGNTNLSFSADKFTWSWNETNGCYVVGSRSFFYSNNGTFKNYALSNLGGNYSQVADIIVIPSDNILVQVPKVDPELSYEQTEYAVVIGEESENFVAPTLINPSGLSVTYSSSDENLAIVDEDSGEILLGNTEGTVTITASFAGNDAYNAASASYSVTLSTAPVVLADPELSWGAAHTHRVVLGEAPANLPVLSFAEGFDGTIEYASSQPGVASIDAATGEITLQATGITRISASCAATAAFAADEASYILVVHTSATPLEDAPVALIARYGDKYFAMKHSFSNGTFAAVEVSYMNGAVYVANPEDITEITWLMSEKDDEEHEQISYSFKYNNGNTAQYINSGSSSNLAVSATEIFWLEQDGCYKIGANSTRSMIYREAAHGFKHYGMSNMGTGDYSDVAAFAVSSIKAAYTRNVTAGNYGTICLQYASAAIEGAEMYTIAAKNSAGILIDEVSTLEAGKPYIFLALSDMIEVTYDANAAAQIPANGIIEDNNMVAYMGAEEYMYVPAGENNYLLTNNTLRQVLAENAAIIRQNRAYIDLTNVPDASVAPQPAPGVRRRVLGYQNGVATGCEQLGAESQQRAKVLIDGRLYIIREGRMFDAQGRLLK